MPEFVGALFDFDGVVVDSTPVHLAGWRQSYLEMFRQSLDQATLSSLVGRSTSAIGSILADLSGFPAAKPELIRRKASYVLANLDKIPLISGSKEFMLQLRAQGLPFGVVSNAPRSFIQAALERHQIPCPFFLGLEDYVRPKPDPEPYVKGARRLGLAFTSHPRIVVFEDSTHGIEAALAANMTAIGICSQHSAEHLQNAGAKYCYPHFEAAGEELLGRFLSSSIEKA